MLEILPGDELILTVYAQVDGSGPIAGNVSGIKPALALCQNSDAGGQVSIDLTGGETSWDCTAAGFIAEPGERVFIVVRGIAD